MVNYSIVQSIAGSIASAKLTEAWGGTIRIGSIGINLLDHANLYDILVVSPENDTILQSERISVRLKGKPITQEGIHVDRVLVKNTEFHLHTDPNGVLNLKYIIDKFPKSEKSKPKKHFVLSARKVILNNVRYHQELDFRPFSKDGTPNTPPRHYDHGVNIKDMDFTHIKARVGGFYMEDGRITCRMEKFSCHEKSGLNINHIEFDGDVGPQGIIANNLIVQTDSSSMMLDAQLRYTSWNTMKYYCDSVNMYVNIKPGSIGNMATAAYWAPVLWGMDTRIEIEGTVTGPVADMHAENIIARFGKGSEVFFNGFITGLPHIDSTLIGGNVERLTTNYRDLCNVKHPLDRPVEPLKLIESLGQMDIAATFLGTYKDFDASCKLDCALGTLMVEGSLDMQLKEHLINYKGKVESPSFQISKIAANEWVSSSGFVLNFQGQNFNPKIMTASIDGKLTNSILRGNPIAETTLEANISEGIAVAEVGISDTLIKMNLDATLDLTQERTHALLNGDIAHADLVKLRLWNNASDTTLKISAKLYTEASINLKEQNPVDNLQADVRLTNTHIQRNDASVKFNSLSLTAKQENFRKSIALQSDLADADIHGYYRYAQLPVIIRQLCDKYIPIYYNPFSKSSALSEEDYASIADADFEMDVRWNDPAGKAEIFMPSIKIARGTRLQCNYGFAKSMKIVAASDSIKLGGIALYDVGLDGGDMSGRYMASLIADHFSVGALRLLENIHIQASSTPERASCSLRWFDAKEDTTRGNINILLNSDLTKNTLTIPQGKVVVHGNPWMISCSRPITLANKHIEVDGLTLQSQSQSVLVDLLLKNSSSDNISANFYKFDLGQLEFLLGNMGLSIDGRINGDFTMKGFGSTPYLDAKLLINDFVINNQPLGDADIISKWDSERNLLKLDVATALPQESGIQHPLTANGYIALGEKDPSLDFDVRFGGLSLQTVEPFVKSFSSQLEGYLKGRIDVEGSLSKPVIRGGAKIDGGLIKVDFLNVAFSVNDSVTLTHDNVIFNNFTIRDPQNNPAYLNGKISHKGLKDIKFDLTLNTDNLLVMNTTPLNGDFYGRILASANGRITGTDKDMNIAIDAKTMPGCQITYPINNKRQVKELNYIQFVDENSLAEDHSEGVIRNQKEEESSSGFNYRLTMNLNVTPDVKMNLPLDFSPMSADLKASGQGDLQISLGSASSLSILGNYEFSNGNMVLDLLGLISREFTIAQGSSINFTGAIPDAQFNIDAVYSQRVNLATLTGISSSTERSSQTIPVQDVIQLSGSLTNPELGFDIRLPNVDQSVSEEVFSYIDRTNDRDMLNQTVYLLVFGQFYNSTVSNSTSIENSGYSVVANSVGSVVSDMVQFVNVNFDYTAESELTAQQFDVDISKDWGKFYLESTLGIGESNNINNTNGRNNNVTGDVLLGYKIRPNIHFFVFNRSNTNDYTRSDLPYKQGLGLKYTKDFNKLSDLFGGKTKKAKKR